VYVAFCPPRPLADAAAKVASVRAWKDPALDGGRHCSRPSANGPGSTSGRLRGRVRELDEREETLPAGAAASGPGAPGAEGGCSASRTAPGSCGPFCGSAPTGSRLKPASRGCTRTDTGATVPDAPRSRRLTWRSTGFGIRFKHASNGCRCMDADVLTWRSVASGLQFKHASSGCTCIGAGVPAPVPRLPESCRGTAGQPCPSL